MNWWRNKFLSQKQLVRQLGILRKKNKTVVFTNGCFDILHSGHLMLLYKAKRLGDILVVGLNTDKSVRRNKGDKRPIVSQTDRAKMLAGLTVVDFITLFGEDTPEKIIRRLKPDVLVKGGDWKFHEIVGHDIVPKTVRVKLSKDKSTSGLIDRIVEVYD